MRVRNVQKLEGCTVITAKPTEDILKNIQYNVNRPKREVSDLPEWRDNLPIAIVGGGPSLKDTIKNLADYKYVMVCGSAHDYVIRNSKCFINYVVVCDPDELVINYLQEKPSIDTKYLIASQCDPKVFEHLKDERVHIWHSGGVNDNAVFGEGKLVLGGGCTVGTRAICMALGLGFSKLHLYGFDTCLSMDFKHHAYDFNDPEKETLGNITEIALDGPNGKKFHVAGYMLGQLFDFQKLIGMYAHRMEVTVFGDGLLKHLMDLTQKKLLEAQNGN